MVPVGTGILLLGGRGNRIENNRIHGNFLTGVARSRASCWPRTRRPLASSATSCATTCSGLNGTDVNGSRRDVRRQRHRQLLLDGGRRHRRSRPIARRSRPAPGRTRSARQCSSRCSASSARTPSMPGTTPAPGQGRATPHSRCSRRKSWIGVLAGAALLSAALVQGALRRPSTSERTLHAPDREREARDHRHLALAGVRGGRRRP